LFLRIGQDRHSPSTKQKKAEQLHLLSFHSEKQEHRFLLLQCHALPESLCSTLFASIYKRPLKDSWGFFFCLLGLYFGLFGVETFWKGKELLKGKIAEG
jgi:hypothetical protein